MISKVLLVDDDPGFLAASGRHLRKFDVTTAKNGIEGLKKISGSGLFAVVISDMRMPHMNGIQFLNSVLKQSPESVRVLITGFPDLQNSMEAINEGNIFRFLTKPCPIETLIKTVQDGIDQFHLQLAEKELLEETLTSSVEVLTDILGLVNPSAFGRLKNIREYVRLMVRGLVLEDAWQYELAAMLSLIGCVTIPSSITDKMYAGMVMDKSEKALFNHHPLIGSTLIRNIPRLDIVAGMVENQAQLAGEIIRTGNNLTRKERIKLGGHLIRIALDFDKSIKASDSPKEAFVQLSKQPDKYLPEAVQMLKRIGYSSSVGRFKNIGLGELKAGMVLGNDILTKNGLRVALRGQIVTNSMIEEIHTADKTRGIVQPLRVVIRKT